MSMLLLMSPALAADLGTTLMPLLAEHHVPGLAIAVLSDGDVAFTGGFGALRAGTDTPVTADIRFQIASISKTVAAFTCWRLARDGRIDLDADVREDLVSWQLPESPFDGVVSPRRLLEHRAGINVDGSWGFRTDRRSVPSLLDFLAGRGSADRVQVVSQPGVAWAYSTGGYAVLEQWLVDSRHQPYAALAEAEVFEPTGMASAGLAPSGTDAVGHTTRGRPLPGEWYAYPFAAGGGVYGSVADLAHYAEAILDAWHGRDTTWLTRADLEAMFERPDPSVDYALGWHVRTDDQGRRSVYHRGLNRGFTAVLQVDLDADSGAVVLTNGEGGEHLWKPAIAGVVDLLRQ